MRKKDKVITVILALFLGQFGVHKFYLGENNAGFIYLILALISGTIIPRILSLFDLIPLLFISQKAFDTKYNLDILLEEKKNSVKNITDAIFDIKHLYEVGVITAEEYEEKRQGLLQELSGKKKTSRIVHWLQKTPLWIWFSFLPGLGSLAISYAGFKAKTPLWIVLGIGISFIAFYFKDWLGISWVILIGQVILAFSLKKEYNIKISPRGTLIPEDVETAKLIGKIKGTIDINTCSKNDMVKVLGLPIVYANNIESLQNEGYVLTHLEELSEIAGIPENQVKRIAPLIHFCYDDKLEPHLSWRRINVLSVEDLILLGLSKKVAKQIVAERKKKGDYKSVIEVKQRTGLPFHSYRQII